MSLENSLCVQIMNKLFTNNYKADVFFEVHENGSHRQLNAHKIILATGSEVFNKMFYGGPKPETIISITDSTVDAFQLFLQFFYLDSVKFSNDDISLGVLKLAKKYEVQQCFDEYSKFMQSQISIDNVCDVFTVANQYKQQLAGLHKFCCDYIAKHITIILKSPSFRRCNHVILKNILNIARMKSVSPIEIFGASMNWAILACEQDQQDSSKDSKQIRIKLADAFNLIPFDKMPVNQLGQCITQHRNLFETKELEDLIIGMSETIRITIPKRRNSNLDDIASKKDKSMNCEKKVKK